MPGVIGPAQRLGGILLRSGVLGAILATLVAGQVAAAVNVTLRVSIGSCQFFGDTSPKKVVKFEWRDSDGSLKDRFSVKSDSDGNINSACYFPDVIESGDTIKVTVGTSSRTITVPRLTLNVDRDTDTAWGKSTPDTELHVALSKANNSFNYDDFTFFDEFPTTDGSGAYSVDFGSLDGADILGSDYVDTYWTDANGDTVDLERSTPNFLATIGKPYVDVDGNPGTTRSASLYSVPSGTLLAHTTATLSDYDELRFYDADGSPVRVEPGNQIVTDLASDATLTVPTIAATINKSTGKVTVNCGLGAGYAVFVATHDRNYVRYGNRSGHTNGSGIFVADFGVAPKTAIKSGDNVQVYCMLASGDTVSRVFTA